MVSPSTSLIASPQAAGENRSPWLAAPHPFTNCGPWLTDSGCRNWIHRCPWRWCPFLHRTPVSCRMSKLARPSSQHLSSAPPGCGRLGQVCAHGMCGLGPRQFSYFISIMPFFSAICPVWVGGSRKRLRQGDTYTLMFTQKWIHTFSWMFWFFSSSHLSVGRCACVALILTSYYYSYKSCAFGGLSCGYSSWG